ncbi:hypothetical protein [Nocardioides marmoraquaticus]
MTTVRDLLATAATQAGGVGTVSPYYRQTTKPGDGFVRLERIEYPNPFGGVCYWNVVLLLPQSLDDAERWIEQYVPDVRRALAEHMTVTRVRPERLIFPGAGEVPCVFINGSREED